MRRIIGTTNGSMIPYVTENVSLLRYLRGRAKLSIREVAAKVGLPASIVGEMENYHVNATQERAEKLGSFYGVDPQDIIEDCRRRYKRYHL